MKKTCLLSCLFVSLTIATIASPAAAGCAADFNGDGTVGSGDLSRLLGDWGTADPQTDLNGNGIVGEADLNMLLDNWGACPTCPADLDGDGSVGALDRQLLEQAYGTACNGDLGRNGTIGDPDLEILLLSWTGSADPDADPRADLNGDGVVNSADLGQLLGQWGNACEGDLNSDGNIDTDDLWFLLGSWGRCP